MVGVVRGVLGRSRRRRLGMADEDLGAGRQPGVVGREDDVERVDGAAGVLRPVGDGRLRDLLEHDQIAPVAQLDAQVRRRRHLRSEDDEVRHVRAGRVGAGGGGLRPRRDALGRDLAVEERDAEDVADRLRAGRAGRARGDARRERAGADERAVGGEDEGVGDAGRRRARARTPRPRSRRAGRERGSRGRSRRRRRSPAPRASWRRSPQQRATRRSGAARGASGTRAPLSGSGETMRRSS